MAILITAHQLTHAFGARPLFKGIGFTIESGDRIGLIGPNGMGKSTLLRLLAGVYKPDSGTLTFQKGLRVGYLAQVPEFKPGQTIGDAIEETAGGDEDWEKIENARAVMASLKIDNPELMIHTLSGGWKKRVALGRELARQPDLLLMDEPTNHLDVESIVELEEIIRGSRFATLTVTHDRAFLQNVSARIFELDRRNPDGLLCIRGDYATYLETKEQMMNAQESREVILKNTLRRETEWLRRGAKARTTKQQARIQRHGELSSEVAELETRNRVRTARIDFEAGDKKPKRLLEAEKISRSIGDKTLFKSLSLLLTPGTRIGLLGPNGCGKSTLIRVLLGQETPDSGSVKSSEHLKVAFFEQNRETLDPKLSVAKTLCPSGDHVDFRGARVHVRGYLDRFMFGPDQAQMAVGKLSGGEQSRILLARLMLQEANLLVLDEPTNDLDVATLNILEECLADFPGAVLLVTHDRYFLDQVATKILAWGNQGQIESFADLSQWELWREEQASLPATTTTKGSTPESLSKPAARKKLGFKEQREFETIEKTVHAAEAELARLTALVMDPATASNATKMRETAAQLEAAQSEIDRLYKRWQELEERA